MWIIGWSESKLAGSAANLFAAAPLVESLQKLDLAAMIGVMQCDSGDHVARGLVIPFGAVVERGIVKRLDRGA